MARKKRKSGRMCPVCRRARMVASGKIKPGGKGPLRTVYMCPKCGYRSL